MLSPSIGIIRISQWGATTPIEFTNAVNILQTKGLKKLILDLRDNSGGYLGSAVQVANEFFKKGELIVYTEGNASPRDEFRADGNGKLQEMPLIILVNEFSASASEIFAGAMQDHDRATIIGRRTFGKGLVQRPFYLPDSSQVRLTIARYYSPSGRCIQKKYTLGDLSSYQKDLSKRYLSGELFDKDSIAFEGTKTFKTDAGKIVHDGTGISPSIFIPIDSTGVNTYYIRLLESGLMGEYSFLFVDKNRKELNQYKGYEDLKNYLSRKKNIIYEFSSFASSKGIPKRPAMLYEAQELIRRNLSIKIASYLLGTQGAYLFLYEDDPAIRRAKEVFSEEKTK